MFIDPMQMLDAIAASTAFPPSRSMLTPMLEQMSNSVATAPCVAWTRICLLAPFDGLSRSMNSQAMNAVDKRTSSINVKSPTITFRFRWEKSRHCDLRNLGGVS
jgi:hypothetical protein